MRRIASRPRRLASSWSSRRPVCDIEEVDRIDAPAWRRASHPARTRAAAPTSPAARSSARAGPSRRRGCGSRRSRPRRCAGRRATGPRCRSPCPRRRRGPARARRSRCPRTGPRRRVTSGAVRDPASRPIGTMLWPAETIRRPSGVTATNPGLAFDGLPRVLVRPVDPPAAHARPTGARRRSMPGRSLPRPAACRRA